MNTQPETDDREQRSRTFAGCGFAITEIILSMADLTAKVNSLRQGNSAGSAVQQKLAAEEVSKIARQIQTMADTISRVTIAHLNRRSRVT